MNRWYTFGKLVGGCALALVILVVVIVAWASLPYHLWKVVNGG